MNHFFSSPSVVVIDDEPNHAIPILAALSRLGIPSAWFEATEKKKLPQQPLQNVRLLILDLNLGTSGFDVKFTVGAVLNTIAPTEVGGPLLIMAWTTHDDNLAQFNSSLQDYNNDLPDNEKVQPIGIIPLKNKSEFVTNPKENDVDDLAKQVRDILSELFPYNILLRWEAACTLAASDTVSMIAHLAGLPSIPPLAWKNYLALILKKLTEAAMGQTCPEDINNQEAIESLFKTLTSVLDDKIGNDFSFFNPTTIMPEQGEQQPGAPCTTYPPRQSDTACIDLDTYTISKINSMLLTENSLHANNPGSIISIRDLNDLSLLPFRSTDQDWNKTYIESLFSSSGKLGREPVKRDVQILNECSLPIIVEVSPSCDVAQQKRKLLRFIFGLLFPIDYFPIAKYSGYAKRIGPLLYKECPSGIILDSRHFFSLPLTTELPKAIFRFRKRVHVDIQAWLASELARPGHLFVDIK